MANHRGKATFGIALLVALGEKLKNGRVEARFKREKSETDAGQRGGSSNCATGERKRGPKAKLFLLNAVSRPRRGKEGRMEKKTKIALRSRKG